VGDAALTLAHVPGQREQSRTIRQVVSTLFQGSTSSAKESATVAWQSNARWQGMHGCIVAHRLERPSIVAIKALHTAIFGVLMACVVYVSLAGVRDRMTRHASLALVAIVAEGLVISRNNGRCPLTDMVEELGGEHGSVSDIFLPRWVAEHIPHISCTLLGIGMATFATRRAIGAYQPWHQD
jgi:hypothetical protein